MNKKINILEKLHAEYVTASPVPANKCQKAITDWKKALQKVEEAEEKVKLAKIGVSEAVKDIIRTHGRGPFSIEGLNYNTTYYPGDGRVFIVPIESKNGRAK